MVGRSQCLLQGGKGVAKLRPKRDLDITMALLPYNDWCAVEPMEAADGVIRGDKEARRQVDEAPVQ